MLAKIRISLLSLLLVLSGLLWFVATTPGTKLIIHSLIRLMPGTCTLNIVQGNLLQGIVIDNLYMRNHWVNVDASQIILRWSLTPTSLHHFIITQATLSDVVLARPEKPPFLHIPRLQVQVHHQHAEVSWQALQLPLSPTFFLHSPYASLHLTGKWLDFTVDGQVALEGTQIPAATWEVQGKGSVLGLTQVTATANPLQGQVITEAQVHWIPPITWQAKVAATKLHWQYYQPSINAVTDMDLTSDGYFALNEPFRMHINLDKLSGMLSGYPVSGTGGFAIENHTYEFKQLQVQSQKALLQLHGQYGQQTDISWQLSIPNLQQLMLVGTGSILSSGQLTSDKLIDTLRGNAKANVNNLCYKDICLQQGKLLATFNNQQQSNVSLNILQLQKQKAPLIHQGSITFTSQSNHGQLRADLALATQRFQLAANGQRQGQQLQLNIAKLALTGGKLPISLNHPVNASMNPQHLLVQPFCFDLNTGQLCVKTWTVNRSPTNQISGTISASSQNLRWLSAVSPKLKNPDGQIQVDLTVSGENTKPQLNGTATLTHGQLSFPAYGVTLKPIDASLHINHNQFDYQLALTSDQGKLNLKGQGQIAPLQADVTIDGNDLTVMNNQDANILASPAMTIQIRGTNLTLNGQITIPKANITPKDFTNTARLPNDMVWLDDEADKATIWRINQKIRILLGDAIHVRYAGLDAKLGGDLTVSQTDAGVQTAVGVITVPQGKFTAYGQDLTIENGALTFSGGPLNNPGLSISATRQIQNFNMGGRSNGTMPTLGSQQTVGVKVLGTLNSPQLTLFSEPPGLDQADVLSYLVLGRPSAQVTTSQSGMLMNALGFLNLGGSQTGQIKNQLNKAFGLDEFSVGSQQEYSSSDNKVVDNTSVILGKNFSSRLYVNYSIGLLEPINVLQITYKLTQGFQLQSEHSTNGNGVDLFYTWAK